MKKILMLILMTLLISGNNSVTVKSKQYQAFTSVTGPKIINTGTDTGKQTITLKYANVKYYGADNCSEEITFILPYQPGSKKSRLWDASKKKYINGDNLNYIISGQGFDATVRVEAKLSGANCVSNVNKISNYEKFYEKLTATGTTVKGMPLKIVLSLPQLDKKTTYLLKYDGTTPKINNGITGLTLNFKIDQAWHDTNTLDTVYVPNKPTDGNYEMLGTRGYYFTNFEDCPTIDKTNKPVAKNFYFDIYYDSEAGSGSDIGDTAVFENNTIISGSFYLIQQILIANNKSACLSPNINKLTNNFEYTLINLNDPFGINKFGKSNVDEASLAPKYYYNFSNYAPPNQFDNIFANDKGDIILNYASGNGMANFNELKTWSNKTDQDKITIGACTAEFKSLINVSTEKGQPC